MGSTGGTGAYSCLSGKRRAYLRRSPLSLDLHKRDPALQIPGGRKFQAKGRTSARTHRQVQTWQVKKETLCWVIVSRGVGSDPR